MLLYDFENDERAKIQHTALAYINILPKTSVVENTPITNDELTIFPNPIIGNEYLNIRTNIDILKNMNLSIYNLNGELLEFNKDLSFNNGIIEYKISGNLPTGSYFLILISGEKRWMKQFQVIK
jgi:hypothetical protein